MPTFRGGGAVRTRLGATDAADVGVAAQGLGGKADGRDLIV